MNPLRNHHGIAAGRIARLRSVLPLAMLACAAASVFVVACSDDTNDNRFTSDSDAATDAPVSLDAGNDADAFVRDPFNPADVPVACASERCATQLVAGSDHFCARMNDGTVRCWGSDAWGVLGTTPVPDDGSPIPDAGVPDAASTVHSIEGLTNVTQLSAAGATTCARLDDGTVECWGDNRSAQLGIAGDPPVSDWDPHPTPAPVALASSASRVDVGQGIACARLESGKLWCWGRNDQQQLVRDGDSTEPAGPGAVGIDPLALTRTAMSDYTMLGLDANGAVWGWGAIGGDYGTVAGRVGSIPTSRTPNRIGSFDKVTSLVASVWILPQIDDPTFPPPPQPPPRAHACALANGEVYCWGRSYTGALCTGLPDAKQEPTHAPFALDEKAWPQQLAVGDEITCARMTHGSVRSSWGDEKGRLGTGTLITLAPSFTRAFAFGHHAVHVATSDRTVCALVEDGTVECWGSNEKGELGHARDGADHPAPVKVVF